MSTIYLEWIWFKNKNICPLFDWMSLSNQFIKLWNCFLTQNHFGRYWLLSMYYSPINFFITEKFWQHSDNISIKLTKLFHSKVNHKVNLKINIHVYNSMAENNIVFFSFRNLCLETVVRFTYHQAICDFDSSTAKSALKDGRLIIIMCVFLLRYIMKCFVITRK